MSTGEVDAQAGFWKRCMRWLSPTGYLSVESFGVLLSCELLIPGGITSGGTGAYRYSTCSGGGMSSNFLTSTSSLQ